jgi:hypothetical protein
MSDSFDIEIGIYPSSGAAYRAELRFTPPGGELKLPSGPARFDFLGLKALENEPQEYGTLLFESLFADRELRSWLDQALANAGGLDVPVRIRLVIPPGEAELHRLRWELLRDPRPGGGWVCTDEGRRFSRYLGGASWETVRLPDKRSLRALAAVASPGGLELAGVGLGCPQQAGEEGFSGEGGAVAGSHFSRVVE